MYRKSLLVFFLSAAFCVGIAAAQKPISAAGKKVDALKKDASKKDDKAPDYSQEAIVVENQKIIRIASARFFFHDPNF